MSSQSSCACRCTRPSSQVGAGQPTRDSLCPVETRARPSRSPSALQGLCGVSQLCSRLLLQKICVLLPPPTPSCEGISMPVTSRGKRDSSEALQRAEPHRSALTDGNLWSQGRQQRHSAAPCPFHFRFTRVSGLLDSRDTLCVPNALSTLLSVL